jgi:hypothetical protein
MDYPKIFFPKGYLEFKANDPAYEAINGLKRSEPKERNELGWLVLAIGLAWALLLVSTVVKGVVFELFLGIKKIQAEIIFPILFIVWCILLYLLKGAYDDQLKQAKEVLILMDKRFSSPLEHLNWRENGIRKIVSSSSEAMESMTTFRKGYSENQFYEQCFESKILFNALKKNISIFNEKFVDRAYVCDLAYVNQVEKVFIDIEIDEPYIAGKDKPIHYGDIDDERNLFFTTHGWFVVRFAEEQIVRYPNKCIAFLESFIRYISDYRTKETFTPIDGLLQIKSWSYEQAVLYVKSRYREKYLNVDFTEFQKAQSESLRKRVSEWLSKPRPKEDGPIF